MAKDKEKATRIRIKKAKKSDFDKIIQLINELAEFEKLEGPDEAAVKRLYKDTFGKKQFLSMLVAKENKEVIGYAIYFYTYSSFLAKKTLYLEDIYVSQKSRNKGIGKLFFKKLIEIANKKSCGRAEWCVLNWNTNAIEFYNKLGAKPLADWTYYRLAL